MKNLYFLWFIFLLSFSEISFSKDVHKSWDSAIVLLPNTAQRVKTSEIKINKKVPVLIYLHGCTGIHPNHDLYGWAEYIAGLGVLVILPDSFARDGRVANCDTTFKRRSGKFPNAYKYRQEEIGYAIAQLKSLPWFDDKNFFLMGHSEGGSATAESTYPDFTGIIISGWTCTDTTGFYKSGISSPKHVPILAIADINDPWRVGSAVYGRCKNWDSGRNLTQIDLSAGGHETYYDLQAREAVLNFLKTNVVEHTISPPKKIEFESNETDEPLVLLN